MIAANSFSVSFTNAILMASKAEDLLTPPRRLPNGHTREQTAQMEHEMTALQQDLTSVKDTYAKNTLTLSITVKYLTGLLSNKNVDQYLTKHHPDLLRELQDAMKQPNE